MAKDKSPIIDRDVPPTVALIAGSLAATVSTNGVMAGAHDMMLALQALRVHNALITCKALCDEDPELLLEPITDKAIGRLNELIKRKREEARVAAEQAAAEEAAAAEAEAKAAAKAPAP